MSIIFKCPCRLCVSYLGGFYTLILLTAMNHYWPISTIYEPLRLDYSCCCCCWLSLAITQWCWFNITSVLVVVAVVAANRPISINMKTASKLHHCHCGTHCSRILCAMVVIASVPRKVVTQPDCHSGHAFESERTSFAKAGSANTTTPRSKWHPWDGCYGSIHVLLIGFNRTYLTTHCRCPAKVPWNLWITQVRVSRSTGFIFRELNC